MPKGDIAVVGMACVFPGAKDLDAYWRNLTSGVDAIGELPAERWPGSRNVDLPPTHPAHIGCRRGGFVATPYLFDPARYGVMPKVARHGDPDQFILLDVLAAALADAGIGPDDPRRRATDLIVGRGGYTSNKMMEVFLRADGFERLLEFLRRRFPSLAKDDLERLATDLRGSLPAYDVDGLASSIPNLVPSRAANRLDLQGTAYTVDAACASSLIAVENAVGRLRAGHCDVALAAGINFTQIPSFWFLFTRILAMSPTERIRPFDRRADGMLIGEGAGAVVLKRVEDAARDGDRVYAVVRGTGSASDGRAVGVLAPSSHGQVRALERAYADAGVDPDTVSFLEAHGTGTPAGDLAELDTIARFFGRAEAGLGTRAMGSVKSMIGHTMPAAGIASFIKAALALSNKILPPSLHCEQPHERLEDTAFFVNGELRPWLHTPSRPRRAGVNAFGFGGINAHVVLEEAGSAPLRPRPVRSGVDRPSELLVLDAADRAALDRRLRRVGAFVATDRSGHTLEDVAFALAGEADPAARCRLAWVQTSLDDLPARIDELSRRLDAQALATREAELLFYEETPDGDAADASEAGQVAAVFPGLGFPGLVGEFPRHLLLNCIHFPRARGVFDLVEHRDDHPDDPIPTSFLLVPPAHLSPARRTQLQARFAPPPMVRPEDVSDERVKADERNLSHMGMLTNNWASWWILRDLGVPVDMLCGQSLGDVSAVLAAGMADFEENVPRFWRAFDLQLPYHGTGLIAMVGAEEERVLPHLATRPGVSIGLHLSPTTLVIGGPETEVRDVAQALRAEGILAQTLPFPPIHTPQLEAVQDEFSRALSTMTRLKPAEITIYSAVLAAPMPRDPEAVEELLRTNVSRPIRFWQTLRRMVDDGARYVVQIGSGTLAANSRSVLDDGDAVCVAMDVGHRHPVTQLQAMAGQLFAHGLRFDLPALFAARAPRPLDLDQPQAQAKAPRAAVPLTLYWPPMWTVMDEPSAPATAPIAAATVPPGARRGPRRGALPFLGRIVASEPSRHVSIETTLTLDEHRYLADHAFVNAQPHKPLSACLPVVPLTMTLEMMAEAAACVAPGLGLLAFESVRARRWIAFEDVDTLVVRLEARRSDASPDVAGDDVVRVETQVLVDDQVVASAQVSFGTHYRETCQPAFHELEEARPLPVRAADLYDQGFLFHGDRFRCLAALGLRGRRGITGDLRVLDRSDLFASDAAPQLLVDPVVLDGAGQLVGAFFHGAEGYVLPVAVDRIEFYRPPPDVGAVCPARVEFREIDLTARRTRADLEVQDGAGRVWFRIEGWQDVSFPWKARLLEALRQPERHPLASPRDLEGVPDGAVATLLDVATIADIQLDWLARAWLAPDEWQPWQEAGRHPGHRRQWLMGRIAAKDAVRVWLARRTGDETLRHPARITLGHEASGQPVVLHVDGTDARPRISLSHVESGAAAAAWSHPIGIDVARRDAAGALELGSFTTAEERERVATAGIDATGDATWRTGLWCAKEAAGKLLGDGLAGRPRALEIVDAASDGQLALVQARTGRGVDVHVSEVEGLVVAVATSPPVGALVDGASAAVEPS